MAGDKYYHSIKIHRYLRGPESIEIPPFRPQFIKFSKTVSYEVNFGMKVLILIDADSGPFRYVLMLR